VNGTNREDNSERFFEVRANEDTGSKKVDYTEEMIAQFNSLYDNEKTP